MRVRHSLSQVGFRHPQNASRHNKYMPYRHFAVLVLHDPTGWFAWLKRELNADLQQYLPPTL